MAAGLRCRAAQRTAFPAVSGSDETTAPRCSRDNRARTVDDLLGPGSRQQREDAPVPAHARNARCAEHRLRCGLVEHQLDAAIVAPQLVERTAYDGSAAIDDGDMVRDLI